MGRGQFHLGDGMDLGKASEGKQGLSKLHCRPEMDRGLCPMGNQEPLKEQLSLHHKDVAMHRGNVQGF